MESSWIQSYYDTLEFFYWEPQHLGRKKYADSRFDTIGKVRHHLKQLEVTLNHQFLMVFRLGPERLRRALATELFGSRPENQFTLHDRDAEQAFWQADVMQPDVFMSSATDVFCIEMKIGAKLDVEQVVKYALLGLACELADGRRRRHSLGLVGRGTLRRQWAAKIDTIDDLRLRLTDFDLEPFLRRCPAKFRTEAPRLREIVDSMDLGFMSYGALASFLQGQEPAASDSSDGAEVYRNLLSGFVGELAQRKLT